ncbi:MAG: PaaI family thioesterase [Alphaproteobacteria bacterium]|nr:PaaI family thioesterase [Alphaproteobacteria bacterium SS10]
MAEDGLTFLKRALDPDSPKPPVFDLLEIQFDMIEAGKVEVSMLVREYQYNPIGTVHGGIAATLLDTAVACCIHTTLGADEVYTTLELKVNYVRGITSKLTRVRAIGNIIHRGRRMATSEAKLFGDDDKLYAHANTTCMIMPAPGAAASKG